MNDIQNFITYYGYLAMAFGALIEGETFLVLGGIAAQKGLLHLPGLILLAVVGSMIHDCFFFFIGRFGGHHYLNRKPFFKEKSAGILELFDRYDAWLIVGLRYAYGLRTIIPLILGAAKVSIKRFLLFDFIGGVLWSCTFIVGGYYFGKSLDILITEFSGYETEIAVALVAIVILICALGWWLKSHLKNKFFQHHKPSRDDKQS